MKELILILVKKNVCWHCAVFVIFLPMFLQRKMVLKMKICQKEADKQRAVAVDEPKDAKHSLLTDTEDTEHNNARINGLWGGFMAGAWGMEWYFGYDHPNSDLTCLDICSRDLFWDQCRYVLDFFEGNDIPVTETENFDNLVQNGDYCLEIPGKMYIVFLRNGKGILDFENVNEEFSVKWFDPKNGGTLQNGSIKKY